MDFNLQRCKMHHLLGLSVSGGVVLLLYLSGAFDYQSVSSL